MYKFKQFSEIQAIPSDGSIVSLLKQDHEQIEANSTLSHRVVGFAGLSCVYKKKETFIRVEGVKLRVEDGRFAQQNFPENNDEIVHWDFCSADLSNFSFSGDLYQVSYFNGANLTNADLSEMVVDKIYFNSETKLDGVKFPKNILKKGVLADEASQKQVIAQLGRAYAENGGAGIHRRLSFFNADVSQVVKEYKERAAKRTGGASEATLRQHGFI